MQQVLELVESCCDIRWKMVVCHEEHGWRPPSKAINVGIKSAVGEYILIVSPESAFVHDVPHQMLAHASIYPNAAICGRLNHCLFSELSGHQDVYEAMVRHQSRAETIHHYGSILVSRAKAIEVGGFDECLTTWGGDDDNFRARLVLASVPIRRTNDINIVHLSEARPTNRPAKTKEELAYLFYPKHKACPVCSPHWGAAFNDLVWDWSQKDRSV